MNWLPIIYCFALHLFALEAYDPDPLSVELSSGKIRGRELKSYKGQSYYAFQEIPYAAPPIGKNRFKLPKDPEPWKDILNTTKNTVVCYQQTARYNLTKSENCLYLNVYTPVKPGSSKLLPVYFWIHGGGYVVDNGTFQLFGPHYVMDYDVVVVTINYRLGPFGFLTTEDDVIPGNLGLKDQRFALKWVKKHISLFGGNSSMVTIGGESAGDGSVGYQILGKWKNREDLFHGAIMQSGHAIFPELYNVGRAAAFTVGRSINRNFKSENSTDLLALLQTASPETILQANVSNSWCPIIEKEGDFSYAMLQSLMDGNFKHVPLLIGFNSEEQIYQASNKDFIKSLEAADADPSLLLHKLLKMSDANRTIAGRLLKRIYTKTSFKDDPGAFIRYTSDKSFSTPILKWAKLEAPYTDVYLYRFAYKGPMGGQMQVHHVPGAELVGHAEDLRYMWDDGGNSDLSKFPAGDQLMVHRYLKIWTNFIKYHNPTPEKDPLLQNIVWPKLNHTNDMTYDYLNMNVTLELQKNPRNFKENEKILDEYILPPYIYY